MLSEGPLRTAGAGGGFTWIATVRVHGAERLRFVSRSLASFVVCRVFGLSEIDCLCLLCFVASVACHLWVLEYLRLSVRCRRGLSL